MFDLCHGSSYWKHYLGAKPLWGLYQVPQTGFYSESYAGGKVPEAIDSTGFDAIIIRGQSADPIVLAINPEGVDFHKAEDIWGMDTFETEDVVLERLGRSDAGFKRPGAVVIGPAGENLVCFAVIENEY